jgi:hypothetical protein
MGGLGNTVLVGKRVDLPSGNSTVFVSGRAKYYDSTIDPHAL